MPRNEIYYARAFRRLNDWLRRHRVCTVSPFNTTEYVNRKRTAKLTQTAAAPRFPPGPLEIVNVEIFIGPRDAREFIARANYEIIDGYGFPSRVIARRVPISVTAAELSEKNSKPTN